VSGSESKINRKRVSAIYGIEINSDASNQDGIAVTDEVV
jgi:hypothetical protein